MLGEGEIPSTFDEFVCAVLSMVNAELIRDMEDVLARIAAADPYDKKTALLSTVSLRMDWRTNAQGPRLPLPAGATQLGPGWSDLVRE